MPMSFPRQSLKFIGDQSTSFLNSLYSTPPANWSSIKTLDISGVTFVTPVVCAFTGVARSRGWNVESPVDTNANKYLNYMLEGATVGNTRYIPLTICTCSSDSRKHSQRIKEIISEWVPANVADDFDYALLELMNNVFDHSESPEGFWVHAQKYPNLNFVELIIIDSGIGISRSFRQTFPALEPGQAFQKALELQITSKPEKNAGEGLSSTLEWIIHNQAAGARGLVMSHEHVWYCGVNSKGITNRGITCWPGTIVWLRIPFTPDNSLVDVWAALGLTAD